jgi:hypothetical protein
MPVTYSNRKGHTYYLCQGVTKTGRSRYYFSQAPKDSTLEQIPEGYQISESVNGIVSLVKDRPQLILDDEFAIVEAALRRRAKGQDYRASVKQNRIIIYERLGPDADALSAIVGKLSPLPPDLVKARLQTHLDKMARFSPILRFILVDLERRSFKAEYWFYSGKVNGWVDTGYSGKLDKLSRRLIPKLGSDDFFEMF